MKKLLFIYYKLNLPGGIARVLTNLANELVDEYELSILILVKDKTSFYHLDERVKIISVDSYQHWAFTKGCVGMNRYFSWLPKKNNIKGYLYDFGAYQTLNQWLKENHQDYDTIITCQYKLSIGLAQNLVLAKKAIAWEHTDHNVGGGVFNRLRLKHYNKLKNVIALNKSSYDFYKKLNKQSVLISNIIGNPFENVVFNQNKQNRIVFVGRLDKEKNVQDLLEIFELANLPSDWELDIVGDGNQIEYLKEQIQNYQKRNLIHFHGRRSSDEILRFYLDAKIFGFTSLKEALPLVLVESMMCGNALISYDCNYGPSDIVNENNGFLIPLHDKKMFQEKLEYLTQNPVVLENLMKSSFEESKKWRKEKMINQWKEIL